MPDSSDSILTRLRESVPTKGLEDPWIRLADAEAAVRDTRDATVKEIVEMIRDNITGIADNDFEEGANAALIDLLAWVARRFPNGGTQDGG